MYPLAFAVFIAVTVLLASSVIAQSPGCVITLSNWELQLPVGDPGNPTTIPASQLGCPGFQDQYFFYGKNDASVVMTVPGSPASAGCVTTPNSEHCRTELRETSPSSWDPNGPANRMQVFLAVVQAGDSSTCIGQIHIDDSISSKPVCQIYYNSDGQISLGIEQTLSGGNEVLFTIGTVPLGTSFSYVLGYENNVLSLSLNNQPAQTFPTYSLNAPLSYFKVGNYNQGSTPSEVHFFAIDVSHDSSGIPFGGNSPPASTISFPGIGPIDIITTLAPFPSFFPVAPDPGPSSCDVTGPGNSDDNTVTLELYSDSGCCNSVENIKIGNLNECKNTNEPFSGFAQSVGQNLFGQGIHIQAFTDTGCTGTLSSFDLTNQGSCTKTGLTWQSFQIAGSSSSSSTSSSCVTQPSNSDENTVTLDLYTPGDCCSGLIETIKIGNLGVCHTSNSAFQGVTQAVGQSLFSHGTHVNLYTDSNCQSSSRLSIDLTNNPVCYNTGFVANSLLVGPSQTATGGGSGCQPVQASNTSPNTVTLQLATSDCCTFFETITIGNLGVCHKSNQAFGFFSQAVGDNLFGQGIHIEVFNSDDCTGDARMESLTNTPQCYTGDTWNSLQVGAGLTPPAPKCDGAQPIIHDADTVTLNLYPDTACCDELVETITIGNLNVCHNSNSGFNSITQAVGQNLFGNDIHIQLYPNTDCSSDVWAVVDLSNQPACLVNQGPVLLSLMVVGSI